MIWILLFGLLAYYLGKIRFESSTPWKHLYDGAHFSAETFYQRVQEELERRNVPDLLYDRESFIQSHIFSTKREYLKISREEYVFFICAAQFGTGMFVSYWLCEKRQFIYKYMPWVAKLFGKNREYKSFYQSDTADMYATAVHYAVMDALEDVTKASGIRGLSDAEKEPKVSST